jgi:hypothetical protein
LRGHPHSPIREEATTHAGQHFAEVQIMHILFQPIS